MPLTTDQKDMVQAVKWFQGMGWEVDELGEGLSAVGAASPERIDGDGAAQWTQH